MEYAKEVLPQEENKNSDFYNDDYINNLEAYIKECKT